MRRGVDADTAYLLGRHRAHIDTRAAAHAALEAQTPEVVRSRRPCLDRVPWHVPPVRTRDAGKAQIDALP